MIFLTIVVLLLLALLCIIFPFMKSIIGLAIYIVLLVWIYRFVKFLINYAKENGIWKLLKTVFFVVLVISIVVMVFIGIPIWVFQTFWSF